jgi:hypothetical protein
MNPRIKAKLISALLLVAVFFTSAATMLDVEKQDATQDRVSKDRLIVHEWGTFTSVSSADGRAQQWSPLLGPSDLPSFVYRAKEVSPSAQGRCIKCELALVRMETPVLYFYADRATQVSVNVQFPQGRITEWYPQTRPINSGISWQDVTILPSARADFPVERGESHYYPARETDAAPLRLSDHQKTEHEKFLFYRGVGNFALPLTVKLAGEQVTVRNIGQEELAQIILFENRGGRVGWQALKSLKGETTLTRPALGQTIETLHCALEDLLTAQGLYRKEAAAMVKTWRDSWFEEGLRVFYIVPRRATDAILPITITPAPTELARVLVGRAEIITPELTAAVQAAARKYVVGDVAERAAAIKLVQPYGRFAQPVLNQMMEEVHKTGGAKASQPIWNFMHAASAR